MHDRNTMVRGLPDSVIPGREHDRSNERPRFPSSYRRVSHNAGETQYYAKVISVKISRCERAQQAGL